MPTIDRDTNHVAKMGIDVGRAIVPRNGGGAFEAVMRTARAWGPRPAHRFAAPKLRFLILTTGRSGSELLVSLLNSHPHVMCDGEVLLTRRTFPDQRILSREALAGLRSKRAYGFKLTRDNLLRQDVGDPAAYVRKLYERGYRLILLQRRNLLEQAVSFTRAEKIGYRQYRRGDGAVFAPMRLDPMQVLAFMFLLEDVMRYWRAALIGIPHISLSYEEHLATPERQQATADEICRALGLAAAPVRSDLIRITPEAPEDQLDNYEEIVRVLSVTRYAKYLPDALASDRR